MTIVKRIQAGQYSVSDGRYIIKDGKDWYVLNSEGDFEFGPITTLASAKEFVINGENLLSDHNLNSSYGRSQSKKEFNAYLASEARNGNYAPVLISITVLVIAAFLFSLANSH